MSTLTTLRRVSRASYYKSEFDKCKNDIKKTWAIINSTINPGKKYSAIIKLYHNNETITDPTQIAETLNNHFVGIGLALKNAIPNRAANSFRKYLPPANYNSIYLQPTTPIEVKKVIMQLKNVKNNQHSMSTKMLKENAITLSNPVALILSKQDNTQLS